MEKINIELAGIPLELTLRYKMFRDRYADFQTEKKPCACIEITPEQCACAARGYEPGTLPESVEDLELCAKACAALLPHGRAIIHAVCFVCEFRKKSGSYLNEPLCLNGEIYL